MIISCVEQQTCLAETCFKNAQECLGKDPLDGVPRTLVVRGAGGIVASWAEFPKAVLCFMGGSGT